MNGNGNGTMRLALALLAGGALGGGIGSISTSWADSEAVREMVAQSPALVKLEANVEAIKEDIRDVRIEQKEQRATTTEIDRKLNRVLVIIEREPR